MKVFAIYLTDSRGISMRYKRLPADQVTRQEADDKAESLKEVFPSLKSIDVKEETAEPLPC